jgi:hypothetical protein
MVLLLGEPPASINSSRTNDCANARACAGCGDTIYAEDADAHCAACELPAETVAELRAMVPAPARAKRQMCGGILKASDGARCRICQHFIDALDARPVPWKESPIAA